MSKFYEHNQRFELKKMIRWEVGILKVKTGILRSTLALELLFVEVPPAVASRHRTPQRTGDFHVVGVLLVWSLHCPGHLLGQQ